ncbi:peptide/nickel transport system permease protein [Symbiobacterium terraclitae]|uniref:Peptide/nickel transport system permease protein n=1 Tax=Symbiobacterium terraclitae TaxID=557451 RepID=A0ABS4JP18_9FIRM|nr:peptide/nickel transport system permease protein [Symbiobacterium terraclitae]
MRRLNFPLILGLMLTAGLLFLLVLPELVTLEDPHVGVYMQVEGRRLRLAPFAPGEFGYVLGSDMVGRDMLARVVYGARYTLGLAAGVILLRLAVALPAGLRAGWAGGRAGRLVQTLAVGFGSIPALALVAMTLGGLRWLIPGQAGWLAAYVAMLVLSGAPRMAEQVRRRVEEIMIMPHVEAARALGATPGRILLRHVLPLMRADLAVMISSEMAWVLLLMGQLAVFGIYVGGTVAVRGDGWVRIIEYLPEWGQMLGANRYNILGTPWIPFYPGLALGLSAAAFHLLAEGFRLRGLRQG